MTSEQLITLPGAIPGMTSSTARYIELSMGEPGVFPEAAS